MSHSSRVKQDIARWVSTGLIDAATGDALARDVDAHDRRSLSFGSILATLAALLMGAAILLVVAANWEAIPRLARLVAIFALIIAAYVGGALFKARGHAGIGEALWLVAVAAFGGGIALVGQMYHLSGDEADALLTWMAGTTLSAVILRSGPLTAAAASLAGFWLFWQGWDGEQLVFGFPTLAIVVWAASLWTGGSAARHILMLLAVFWGFLLAVHVEVVPVALAMAAVCASLFAFAILAPGLSERIFGLDGRLPLHALIGFLVGIAIIQFESIDESAPLIAASLVGTAGSVVALVLAGRESRGLRWLAYLGFSFELVFLYVATVGTMLGTAGLFLASGLVLAVAAFVIVRIERRMRPVHAGEALR